MKKVFVVLLLLIGIVLINSVAEALLQGNMTCYQCAGKYSCGEGILNEWEESVQICRDDVNRVVSIEGECWGCGLGGKSLFSSNKKFEGLGGSCWGGYSGCSVQLNGRSMTVDLYDEDDCIAQWRCVQGECLE